MSSSISNQQQNQYLKQHPTKQQQQQEKQRPKEQTDSTMSYHSSSSSSSLSSCSSSSFTKPPFVAWRRSFAENTTTRRHRRSQSFRSFMTSAPFSVRMLMHSSHEQRQGRSPVLNSQRSLKHDPTLGMPLGTIGTPGIRRSWRGHFAIAPALFNPRLGKIASKKRAPSSTLSANIGPQFLGPESPPSNQSTGNGYDFRVIPANQFSVCVKRDITSKTANGAERVSAAKKGRSRSLSMSHSKTNGSPSPPRSSKTPQPNFTNSRKVRTRASVLSHSRPISPEMDELFGWEWKVDPAYTTYRGLFPRTWTKYDLGAVEKGLKLTCCQISPFIPENYRESSYPVSVFVWTVENHGNTPARVGLMFTYKNGTATVRDAQGGHINTCFRNSLNNDSISKRSAGVTMRYKLNEYNPSESSTSSNDEPSNDSGANEESDQSDIIFGIAARSSASTQVTYRSRFNVNSGYDVWQDFKRDAKLDNIAFAHPSVPKEEIGAAVAATVDLEPHSSEEIVFALAWDRGDIGFDDTSKSPLLSPRYRRFFPQKTGEERVQAMLAEALCEYRIWNDAIDQWQQPILSNDELPTWYRQTLFNELYFLSDNSLWIDDPQLENSHFIVDKTSTQFNIKNNNNDNNHNDNHHMNNNNNIGHFAYIQSREHLMYNTCDVHFYASFALIMLWPKLELSLQRDIAAAINHEDPETVWMLGNGARAIRKRRGAVPHDLGSPANGPWVKLNAYNLHDTSARQDINSQFVLQVFRDYIATGDKRFIYHVWDAVKAAVEYMVQFDRDGDGMIESDGLVPNSTYDSWYTVGISAYTGSLWVACLSAAATMADIMCDGEASMRYHEFHSQAQDIFQRALWNGVYYSCDTRHKNVASDQLAGQWYALACGMDPIVPHPNARTALTKVFKNNVMNHADGLRGAVNSTLSDGRIDTSNSQTQEFWTGTTFGLAALMLHEALQEEAFTTAKGVWFSTYEDLGYGFQTPEAWLLSGEFRALTSMRALGIWAMQWAWERKQKE